MEKNVAELKTTEEKKILVSKIGERVDFLSNKTQVFFEKSISISPEKIENAFTSNKDLMLILEKNNQLITDIKHESSTIRKKYQTNFEKEAKTKFHYDQKNVSLIKNTLAQKDNLVSSTDKLNTLNKKIKYLENRNKKRKVEINNSMNALSLKINNSKLLDLEPMKKDVKLIDLYIDPKEITKTKRVYSVPVIFLIATIILGVVIIWLLF